jgi:hypothetical protein
MTDCRKGDWMVGGCSLSSGSQRMMPLLDIKQGPEFDAEQEIEEELLQGDEVLYWWCGRHALHPIRLKAEIGGC